MPTGKLRQKPPYAAIMTNSPVTPSTEPQQPKRDALYARFLPQEADAPPVEWLIAEGLTDYEEALAFMEARVQAIRE
ncbi:hypothetical protein K3V88_14730, partial [Listeria monocytogenes]|nr:hypothetical protein [Listeria monocytogenes]